MDPRRVARRATASARSPTPEPGPDDVRVRPVASALNHMDLWVTQGRPKPALPHVPGCDVAGVVEAVGPGCRPWRWATRSSSTRRRRRSRRSWPTATTRRWPRLPDPRRAALGRPRRRRGRAGPQRRARPAGRSWAECAAYPLATLTAYRMLRRARLRGGGDGARRRASAAGSRWRRWPSPRPWGPRCTSPRRDAGQDRPRPSRSGAAAAFDSAAETGR